MDVMVVRVVKAFDESLGRLGGEGCVVRDAGMVEERGEANRHQVAALAGLAPFLTTAATPRAGAACVRAGPGSHPASLSAVRHHPKLKASCNELRARGKPAKVALVAIARRLLVILNAMLKEHFQQLPA